MQLLRVLQHPEQALWRAPKAHHGGEEEPFPIPRAANVHLEFVIGFLVGAGCGIVMGLAFAAMCFGVIAKVVIMAATYKQELIPWRQAKETVKPWHQHPIIVKQDPPDWQKPTDTA